MAGYELKIDVFSRLSSACIFENDRAMKFPAVFLALALPVLGGEWVDLFDGKTLTEVEAFLNDPRAWQAARAK